MDPICHTLVGATLSQTGLGKRTTYGTATVLIAANLPDLDAFAGQGGGDLSLCLRRGWTHGVLAMVVLPLLLAGAMLLWHRLRKPPDKAPPDFRWLTILSVIGVLSHPFLDWLNTYGVRLLMPFDGQWFYGDALFIVDPWMWLMLGTAAVLGYSRRRRAVVWWSVLGALTSVFVFFATPPEFWPVKAIWSVWIVSIIAARHFGVAQVEPARRRLAYGMLAVAGVYIAAALAFTSYGRGRVHAEFAARGIEVQRLMVGPVAANAFAREFVAETETGYRYGRLMPPAYSVEMGLPEIPKLPDNAIVRAALASPEVKGLRNWMRFPHAEVTDMGDHYQVWIGDARYSQTRTGGFGTAVVEVPKASLANAVDLGRQVSANH
jgi:inner membrane protein